MPPECIGALELGVGKLAEFDADDITRNACSAKPGHDALAPLARTRLAHKRFGIALIALQIMLDEPVEYLVDDKRVGGLKRRR